MSRPGVTKHKNRREFELELVSELRKGAGEGRGTGGRARRGRRGDRIPQGNITERHVLKALPQHCGDRELSSNSKAGEASILEEGARVFLNLFPILLGQLKF